MKNILKLMSLFLVAILGLYSCDKTAERTYYDESGPLGYSFYQKTLKTEFTLDDNGTYNVLVCRNNASQASSVPLTLTESTGSFTLASPSASFEAGESVTTVSIKYVLQNLNPSLQYSIKLQLPSDQLSYGSDSILTIQGNMRLTWKKLGTGIFSSDFFGDAAGNPDTWTQDLYQANESPMLYYLPGCYYAGYDLRFTVNADNSISYATQPMGYNHPTYGMTSWVFPPATEPEKPHKDGNVFYFVPRFSVSAGTFGQFIEVFTLN